MNDDPPTCALCQQPIASYAPELHHLELDHLEHDQLEHGADRAVDICDACAKRLVDWHAEKIARLFPTKRMKQHIKNRKR